MYETRNETRQPTGGMIMLLVQALCSNALVNRPGHGRTSLTQAAQFSGSRLRFERFPLRRLRASSPRTIMLLKSGSVDFRDIPN